MEILLWCSAICHCQPPDWGYEKAAERTGAVGGGGGGWSGSERKESVKKTLNYVIKNNE